MPVGKIISGEGTGVQRAALDVAVGFLIPVGGTWRHEDVSVDAGRAPAIEKPTERQLIKRNILDSDATLILFDKAGIASSAGAIFVQQCTADHCRPTLIVDIGDYMALERAVTWLASFPASLRLYIAGPNSNEAPAIYEAAFYFLEELLDRSHPIIFVSKIRSHK